MIIIIVHNHAGVLTTVRHRAALDARKPAAEHKVQSLGTDS